MTRRAGCSTPRAPRVAVGDDEGAAAQLGRVEERQREVQVVDGGAVTRTSEHVRVLPLAVAAQVEFESKTLKHFMIFQCQALSSRRFQRGIVRVNLHLPTLPPFSRSHAAFIDR